MKASITQELGHAHVAAIRVLTFRNGRPPTPQEVGELLGSQVELTTHRLRGLEELGIVRLVESPFDVHVVITDHLALEELPEEETGVDLAAEVQDFQKRQEEKAEEFQRIFDEEDPEKEKKEKYSQLESDLRSFKKKKAKKAPWEKGSEGRKGK